MVGFEPTTYGLQNRCSAVELHWRNSTKITAGFFNYLKLNNGPINFLISAHTLTECRFL